MAYRPLPFEGRLSPEKVVVGMNLGGDPTVIGGQPVPLQPAARCAAGTDGCAPSVDGLPEIEVFDVQAGKWVQFAHPNAGRAYDLADAERWVDPASGEVRVKFVNERQDGISFQFQVEITGTVE